MQCKIFLLQPSEFGFDVIEELNPFVNNNKYNQFYMTSIHNFVLGKEENFIQRERKKRKETIREIAEMRANLPVYTIQDIRQYKLPYYQALLLELQEQGYESTEAYINNLFELQENMKQEAGPNSLIWQSPDLKHSKNELKKLSEALKQAEDDHNKGLGNDEMDDFLRAGIEFSLQDTTDWCWLGQELILQSVSISEKKSVTGRHESLCRYCLAKMLIEKVKDYQTAEQQLLIARELSQGKPWNAAKFLPKHTDTLFMCSSYLLHLCYMKQAKQLSKSEPEKAIGIALMAKKRATEACYHEGETEALLLKGECELMINDTKAAITTFNKAYYVQSKIGSQKGMCQAKVELAKAYLQHGNTRLALHNLLLLKAKAEKFDLKFYLAQAYRYLGEYYLNNGEPHKATVLLKDAMDIFTEIGESVQADQVRNLEALSSGLELMPDYIYLLIKTDPTCPDWFENLMRLVQWKDSRKQFWVTGRNQSSLSAKARYSMENVLEEYFKTSESYTARNIGTEIQSGVRTDLDKDIAVQTSEKKDSYLPETVSGTVFPHTESETVAKITDYVTPITELDDRKVSESTREDITKSRAEEAAHAVSFIIESDANINMTKEEVIDI